MGIELKLMPLSRPESDLAHDMISIGQDYELFDLINALPKKKIEKPIWSYEATLPNGESGYGQIEKDPYGDRLSIITSTVLLSIKDHPCIADFWRVKAAWAYLAQMPEDWPIVLYWH
jgi:hypothetical protein